MANLLIRGAVIVSRCPLLDALMYGEGRTYGLKCLPRTVVALLPGDVSVDGISDLCN